MGWYNILNSPRYNRSFEYIVTMINMKFVADKRNLIFSPQYNVVGHGRYFIFGIFYHIERTRDQSLNIKGENMIYIADTSAPLVFIFC